MSRSRFVTALAAVLVAAATAASAGAAPARGDKQEIERVGATAIKYRGPEVEAVLSHRYASANLGDDWLLLDLALTGAGHEAVEVKRERVSLRLPNGETLLLATQEEFGAAYGELAGKLARADIAGEPLGYWVGRREEVIPFFTAPGQGLVFPSFSVNDRLVYFGRLAFEVPGGVQAGRYELRVKLEESELRIPFQLGER